MSAGSPSGRAGARRLLVAGLVLIALAACFVWTALRRAPSVQSAASSPSAVASGSSPAQGGTSLSAPGAGVTNRTTTGPLSAQHILRYGNAEGEVGMVHEREQPPVGPESFAIGKDGSVLVADVVNQRVVVYSRDGDYLRSLSLPGIALGDVMTDEQGRVYVYDQVNRTLHQYDADGTARSTLDLNPKDIDTRGYFHVSGGAVYFADAATRDVLVAVVREGVLVAPDEGTERVTDGIHGESGRVYALSLDNGQALGLKVRDPGMAPADAPSFRVPVPGIVSARYVGEDGARRFYVQTERLAGSRIMLEVLAFSPAGVLLTTTPVPENDYALWTVKLVDVRADGTIVQFLPQREQVRLNLFANPARPGGLNH